MLKGRSLTSQVADGVDEAYGCALEEKTVVHGGRMAFAAEERQYAD
jgi:hypothetical protein